MKALLQKFDSRAIKYVQKWPDWLRTSMLLATLIGQPVFTVGAGMLIAGIGWGAANKGLFFSGMVAVVTFGVSALAKLYFRRNRPVTEYVARMRFETYSMPSGHAAGATASYGLLALILSPFLSEPWQYLMNIFVGFFIILIGVSRIYLGAHYPSDVIAGWLVGVIGFMVIVLIM